MAKFAKTAPVRVRGRSIKMILIAAVMYFHLGMISMLLLGADIYSDYYWYSEINNPTRFLVFLINVIYCTAFIFFLVKLIPANIELTAISHWLFVLLAVAVVAYYNMGNSSLGREEIKSGSGIVSTLLTSVVYSYLSAVLLCETNRLKFWIVTVALLFAAYSAFEREVILYLIVPLALRLDRGTVGLFKLGLLGFLGVVTLASYKFILSFFRFSQNATTSLFEQTDIWTVVQLSLMRDNLHTGSIELFYFAGISPEYNRFSYIMPLQLERILSPGARTNGQLATEFYTNGNTGTGFSSLLEAWINLNAFGLILFPLIITLVARRIILRGSAFLTIAMVIFMVKVQRSDLWPAMIIIIVGPILLSFFWKMTLLSSRKNGC